MNYGRIRERGTNSGDHDASSPPTTSSTASIGDKVVGTSLQSGTTSSEQVIEHAAETRDNAAPMKPVYVYLGTVSDNSDSGASTATLGRRSPRQTRDDRMQYRTDLDICDYDGGKLYVLLFASLGTSQFELNYAETKYQIFAYRYIKPVWFSNALRLLFN